jgi:N-acetylmuramoyl-L-alanine amidase
MKIDTTLEAAWHPAVNFEERREGMKPTILLLHYTGVNTVQHALTCLCTPEYKVSCHYLIDEEGRIIQMVQEELRAWHAGQAYWAGETDINSASIGIEIHNPGHSEGYPDFTEAQMQSVEVLSRDIIERHHIAPHRVLGHSDVAPQRKRDPGEKFDWARLAHAGIGHWVEPAVIEGDVGLWLGDAGEAVLRLQRELANYGYSVDETGTFDETTEFAVIAFQRHFRPALVNGRADRSTMDTLHRLIEKLSKQISIAE